MSRITLMLLVSACFFGVPNLVWGYPIPSGELLARPQVQWRAADAYLVFYATHGGKTGHVGLAVDINRVRVTDCKDCPGGVRYDTVSTSELAYFDLWPAEENYSYSFFFGEIPGKYVRLPTSSAAPPITVSLLLRKGLPYAMKDPVDGLARIPTSPTEDAELIAYMQGLMDEGRPFSLYDFNCSDFVSAGLDQILPGRHSAEERVLASIATTPNRLWKAVAAQAEVIILKDPGAKAEGRFNSQRIFSSLQTQNDEN